MKFAQEEVLGLILLGIFYIVSIPLTIYWLIQYKIIASTRHKCITSRHFNTTWAYLICCICSSNIGHPLSIILYYLHINISTSTIVYSYILSDISTFSMIYMCLIRCYMIMWDKKYNLALKEQFWTKKIVNDELETYELENNKKVNVHSLTDNISKFIKYRSTLGNVKYVSIFMCCIALPITLFILISPFIFSIYHNHNINIKLSSIFRFVCTIPNVSIIVFIYVNIPKYNEYIGLKFEIRAIVQIICGTFVAGNLLISFLLYSVTNIINSRFLMLINGNIQIIASFLLFYTSTGFIFPHLRKIIMDDLHSSSLPNNTKNKLQLVFTQSREKNKTNMNALGIPGPFTQDASVSVEKKLKKTITIWRRRKDMVINTKTCTKPSPAMSYAENININTEKHTENNDLNDFSYFDGLPPQYDSKSDTFTRKGTVTSTVNPTGHALHTHIDTITSAQALHVSNTSYYMLSLLDTHKSPVEAVNVPVDVTDKRFEIIHTPEVCNEHEFEENLNKILNQEQLQEQDEVVAHEISDVDDDTHTQIITKGYSHTHTQTSNTHISTGLHTSAAIITPQISTMTDSKPQSRRASSKFNALELLNINISDKNSNKLTNNHSNHTSNRSSKQYTDTPVTTSGLNISGRSTPLGLSIQHSNNSKNSEKRRRHSLSVKDAYAGIKQMFAGKHHLINHGHGHSHDTLDKIYFKITLDDPLHIVLSDENGLSYFADHLCAEFSIENLLFIVEALQYRYCIPMYLFDNVTGSAVVKDIEQENKAESCELLMHIIHQNKKLPISKLLKQHKTFCMEQHKNRYNSADGTGGSPSRTFTMTMTMTDGVAIDFIQDNEDRIRRRSMKKQDMCCKACVVEKFKYIIEKYVSTTSINLPSGVQLELMNIWKQLQIKQPEKRFKVVVEQVEQVEIDQNEQEIDKKEKEDSKISIKNVKNVVFNKKGDELQTRISNDNVSGSNTKEIVPSHSVSPRDIIPDIEVNNTDFPKNNPSKSEQNSHNSQVSMSRSHITSTPVTNTERTLTECDDEEPLPASPIDRDNINENIKKFKEKEVEEEDINIYDGMAPTNSMQEINGNGMLTPSINDEENVQEEKEKIEVKEENINGINEVDILVNDGFGNINYITVFDDAILEIMKLIKSDTWRRFKRSKQFVDWANDFKPS